VGNLSSLYPKIHRLRTNAQEYGGVLDSQRDVTSIRLGEVLLLHRPLYGVFRIPSKTHLTDPATGFRLLNAMRIEPDETIAGYPARAVRHLMRKTLGRSITPRLVSEVLACTRRQAGAVLRSLEEEGWVCVVNDHLEPSLRGSALAQATAAKPLYRCTADRLVSELLDRVEAVNGDAKYAYTIETVVIFGSYLSQQERINDVDVGLQFLPRHAGDDQTRAEQQRRRSHGPEFRNRTIWAAWPKLEILKILQSRSRGLSIQEVTDMILNQSHIVVYESGKRRTRGNL
jgi:hypothetical protein